MLGRIWTDPVWSKVISAIIIALFAGICGYYLRIYSVVLYIIYSMYNFLITSQIIPNWLMIIIVVPSIITWIMFGINAWNVSNNSEKSNNSWKQYTSDHFLGLRWRWRYYDDAQPLDLAAFCPHCDYQLYAQSLSAFRFDNRIVFDCDSCGAHLGTFDESLKSLEGKIGRLIQQKLRNGTWVAAENS